MYFLLQDFFIYFLVLEKKFSIFFYYISRKINSWRQQTFSPVNKLVFVAILSVKKIKKIKRNFRNCRIIFEYFPLMTLDN